MTSTPDPAPVDVEAMEVDEEEDVNGGDAVPGRDGEPCDAPTPATYGDQLTGTVANLKGINPNPPPPPSRFDPTRPLDLKWAAGIWTRGEEQRRVDVSGVMRTGRRLAWKEEVKHGLERDTRVIQLLSLRPLGKECNWKDKAIMSRASLKWREEYKNERGSFLFHQVSAVLTNYAYRNVKDLNRSWDAAQEYHQSTGNLRNCRLVCKSWKKAVDNSLAKIFVPYLGYNNHFGSHLLSGEMIPPFPRFLSGEAVASFIQAYPASDPGSHPLFERKLLIGKGDHGIEENQNQADKFPYGKEMRRLLRRWGPELWQVFIQFDKGEPPETMYKRLVKYLKLMPNLCFLAINNPAGGASSSPKNPIALGVLKALNLEADEFGPLVKGIRSKPLPDMPRLICLFFDPFVPPPLVHAMMTKYNSQLELISGKLGTECPQSSLNVYNSISNCSPLAPFEGDFKSLKEARLVYKGVKGALDVFNIFANVKCLRKSALRQLSLVISGDSRIQLDEKFSKMVVWELSHLEKLFLSLNSIDLKNIDFLSSPAMVSLKELDLNYFYIDFKSGKSTEGESAFYAFDSGPAKSIDSESIQFEMFTGRMYESNIWNMLPQLQKVSISITADLTVRSKASTKVYSRDGYRLHCQASKEG